MKLKDIDTRAPKGFDKEETKKKTKELVKKLGEYKYAKVRAIIL